MPFNKRTSGALLGMAKRRKSLSNCVAEVQCAIWKGFILMLLQLLILESGGCRWPCPGQFWMGARLFICSPQGRSYFTLGEPATLYCPLPSFSRFPPKSGHLVLIKAVNEKSHNCKTSHSDVCKHRMSNIQSYSFESFKLFKVILLFNCLTN